jgi:hypothetical protein
MLLPAEIVAGSMRRRGRRVLELAGKTADLVSMDANRDGACPSV